MASAGSIRAPPGTCSSVLWKGPASSPGSDVPREIAWYADVHGFDSAVRQYSFMGIGYEIISRAILPLLLFRVRQLSITGQKMYTKYWFISQ